ncbi:MAG: relaxase/mobilization nuclease domain-containing protein [Lachnospiraceae bacterium]|nr:relaxase/mobilization nuclease domain-containing protein [Lachnospiraceae bacterium]
MEGMNSLNYLPYGNYTNRMALENVLRYILRMGRHESRINELVCYGGMGIPLYGTKEDIINAMLYTQKVFNISARGGRRAYHEVFNLNNETAEKIGKDPASMYRYAMQCSEIYFSHGFQVVFAVHNGSHGTYKGYHIHFVINSINFETGAKRHFNKKEFREIGTEMRNRLPLEERILSLEDIDKLLRGSD